MLHYKRKQISNKHFFDLMLLDTFQDDDADKDPLVLRQEKNIK